MCSYPVFDTTISMAALFVHSVSHTYKEKHFLTIGHIACVTYYHRLPKGSKILLYKLPTLYASVYDFKKENIVLLLVVLHAHYTPSIVHSLCRFNPPFKMLLKLLPFFRLVNRG